MEQSVGDIGKQAQRFLALLLQTGSRTYRQLIGTISSKTGLKVGSKAKKIADESTVGDSNTTPAQQLVKVKKAYARLQQTSSESSARLQQLERMLINEESRHGAILYYELKAVWNFCHQLLVHNQKQLVKEFESRERDNLLSGYKTTQEKESKDIDRKLERLDGDRRALDEQRREVIKKIGASKQIWHFFTRRKLSGELEEIKKELQSLDQTLHDVKNEQSGLMTNLPPKMKGLSVEARRAVNCHLIAFAQFYYVFLATADINKMVRAARKKFVTEINFGAADRCKKMEQLIAEKKARLKAMKGLRKSMNRQVKRIVAQAKFKTNQQAIPEVSSLDFLLSASNFSENPSADSGKNSGIINVIQDNLWDINKLLIR